jgi:hypothetical protein
MAWIAGSSPAMTEGDWLANEESNPWMAGTSPAMTIEGAQT